MDNVAFELQNKRLIPEAPKILMKWLEMDITQLGSISTTLLPL